MHPATNIREYFVKLKGITRLVIAAVGTFIGVLGTTLHAQDLEPRAYSNSPVGLNFVIAGYGYGSGTVLTDPALPLENVSNESHVGVLGFGSWKPAKFSNCQA